MIKHVMKRDNQSIVDYNPRKIKIAIEKANNSVATEARIDDKSIQSIIDRLETITDTDTMSVEEIQNFIEKELMTRQYYTLAKEYITYRYKRDLVRKSNTTDESILSLLRNTNEEVAKENSNKKAVLNSTKRDLIAGEVNKDLSRRLLLPKHIIEAHDKGVIHFHDMDYFAMNEFNCCLPNFRDMLKNGTSINGVSIVTPKSFRVACNQATQIMAAISSNQYGGQTFYLDTLGEYLAYTKEKFIKKFTKSVEKASPDLDKDQKDALVKQLVEDELKVELKSGVQCIQYQINTLCTSNGQSPFVTIFMYLKEGDPYIEENAMIIEEMLKQRLEGVPNKSGVPVTPTFPKLIYVLTEDNCLKGGRFDYLTKLAIKCSAKRMYPDYISEKVMKENYDGEVFSCMGCVKGNSEIKVKIDDEEMLITFEELWDMMSSKFNVMRQSGSENLYIDLSNVDIYDNVEKEFVECKRINRNIQNEWIDITFTSGDNLVCTVDHPLETTDGKVINAGDITVNDEFYCEVPDTGELRTTEAISAMKYTKEDFCYDVTTSSEHFMVNNIYSHNCRSFLSAWVNPVTGEKQWEGRFNQGVVTLNLPQIALEADKDFDKFWELFEERLTICYEALMCRHKALEGTLSDVSPIHWQDGGIARLEPGEKIDKLLHEGFSTISLGYIGLFECVKHMTGHSHTDEEGREFSLKIMNRLKEATNSWKASTGIGFGLYGTPAESTCYTLCKKDRKQYGIIKDVTDKGYYINSYHIDVREPIDAFTKFDKESIYQKISSGGAISYVEIPNMNHNLQAMEELFDFIYDHI